VYREIAGWDAFEPWLTRLETMAAETIWAAANEVPPEWYGGDQSGWKRWWRSCWLGKSRIRELIEGFGKSDRRPFPKWVGMEKNVVEDWKETRWETSMGRVN